MMDCSVEGCAKPVKSRGWCSAHYEYQRSHNGLVALPSRRCVECGNEFTSRAHNASHCCRSCFHKANRRMKQYGLTRADFDSLHHRQDGACAICLRRLPVGQKLSVDHDHLTGAVRGLLCSPCNTGIGLLQDDPDVICSAAAYVAASHANRISAVA